MELPTLFRATPRRHRVLFLENTGLQHQDVLYRQATLDSEPVIVLDPNSFSPTAQSR